MIGIGILLLLLGLYGLFLVMGDTIESHSTSMKIFLFALPLPYFANSAGWILTEVGRFPWVVFGLMKVQDGVSPTVPSSLVITSLILFTLIYAALMAAGIYLMSKYAKIGPPPAEDEFSEITPEAELNFAGSQS
jgi:cytochrome d ubiquinol oxidase subunit I